MGALDRILQHRPRGALGTTARSRICVLACDDAVLTGRLEEALALGPGEATLIRLPAAGAALPHEVVQRAVAKAVYVEDCDEVLVLGHVGCTLTRVSADAVLDALRRWKVSRAAVPFDVRDLVGAGRAPHAALRELSDGLRRCQFLPESLLVHLAELDESTGELRVLERGDEVKVTRVSTGEANVSGYRSGPVAPPAGEAIVPTEVPAVSAFEPSPIEVILPSRTVTMGASTVSLEPTPLPTSFSAPKRTPPPPLVSKSVPSRASSRRTREPNNPAVSPELAGAIEKLRAFMQAQLPRLARVELSRNLTGLVDSGANSAELVKVLLQPVLELGNERYRVLDEMIVLKEELSKQSPQVALKLALSIAA